MGCKYLNILPSISNDGQILIDDEWRTITGDSNHEIKNENDIIMISFGIYFPETMPIEIAAKKYRAYIEHQIAVLMHEVEILQSIEAKSITVGGHNGVN